MLPEITVNGATYIATADVLPADKCIVCEKPIEGEDARYYEHQVPGVSSEVSGGRSMPSRTSRVRKHFLVAH